MRQLFITGSSKGIGAAIARAACESGRYRVQGYARSASWSHPAYQHQCLNLSDPSELARFRFPELEPGLEQVVLINNAATLGEVKPIGKLSPERILESVTLNLSAPLILSNAFTLAYGQYPASRLIINISTGAASHPYDGWGLYCSTKAAVDMLTLVQDKECGQRRDKAPFLVRAVAPGVVDTAMQTTLREADPEEFSLKEKFVALHREGQLSDPTLVGKAYLDILDRLAVNPNAWPDRISRIPALPG